MSLDSKHDTTALDPGRFATADEVNKARKGAEEILQAIDWRNLPSAAEYIRKTRPDPWTIAFLPYVALDLFYRGRQSRAAQAKRKNSFLERVRKANVSSYDEAHKKAPELLEGHSKRQVVLAISMVNREKYRLSQASATPD